MALNATMREQILAIIWAQFRITRNHFPRTSFGTVLSWSLSFLWHMLFIVLALLVMRGLQHAPADNLLLSVSGGLVAIFAYMQLVPVMTASGGWSLQLDKLQAFPIPAKTLFLIEVVLRLTSAPEMLILLCGIFLGLCLHPGLSPLSPFLLLLFLPLAMFTQLAIRDFILHSFAKNRFREIIAVFFMTIALLPQLMVRRQHVILLKPYLLLVANGRFTPWHQIAALSIGQFSFDILAAVIGWNCIAAVCAHRQFSKSLRQEDSFRTAPILTGKNRRIDIFAGLTQHMPDPLGAVLEKELRALVRMPRFRVLFGMACVFSIFVFLPLALQAGRHSFMRENQVPISTLYGILLLSDALLLNIFGFDRAASQVYFCTPISLSVVIRAKNLAAIFLVALQSLAVPLLSILFRLNVSGLALLSALLASAVVTVFLLATGNLLSVYFPRPIDPRATLRKQGGGKVQLWLLGCTLVMFLLVGFAFLARWATGHDWALPAVLSLELAIGLIVYRIALESSIEHATSSQEHIVAELSKNAAPLSS